MPTVTFRSFLLPPNAPLGVSFSPAWGPATSCSYDTNGHVWTVELPVDVGAAVELKFVLAGEHWQAGANLVLESADLVGNDCGFDDRSVRFDIPSHNILVDSPTPARWFFDRTMDGDTGTWDVIVVGSGAGGGTLAYELAGKGKRVLVLEAGSYLFPMHVGDLPRRALAGKNVDKGVWDLWWQYRVTRYAPAGNAVNFGEGLNLGGKALFWGALAPRMMPWEFANWPEDVAKDLQQNWYDKAEELTRVTPTAPAAPYQDDLRAALEQALPGYLHVDAPIASDYTAPGPGSLPAGIFSTAELLVERKLEKAGGRYKFDNLRVRLNTEALRVVVGVDGVAAGVSAWDHTVGRERTFNLTPGGSVVLAAGTLGTPVVAAASGLPDPDGLIGIGLTDHAIYTSQFVIGAGNLNWYRPGDSAMTLSRSGNAAGQPVGPFNVKLELNTNLSLSRYTDRNAFSELADGDVPCELVFMLESPLSDNSVRPLDPRPGELTQLALNVTPTETPDAVKDQMRGFAAAVAGALDVQVGEPSLGALGSVGHEVGTMRIGGTDAQNAVRAGVVDSTLRVVETENVYVCDLSVLPSSPAANPTLTLVALAMRLADRL